MTSDALQAVRKALQRIETDGVHRSFRQRAAMLYQAAYAAIDATKNVPVTSEVFATTVAVGLVPGRSDGMLSLHIGNTQTMLDPTEASRLALDLTYLANPYDATGHKARFPLAKEVFQRRSPGPGGVVDTDLSENERKSSQTSTFGGVTYYAVVAPGQVSWGRDRRKVMADE